MPARLGIGSLVWLENSVDPGAVWENNPVEVGYVVAGLLVKMLKFDTGGGEKLLENKLLLLGYSSGFFADHRPSLETWPPNIDLFA